MTKPRVLLVVLLLLLAVCGPALAAVDWSVVSASWRPDENPWAKQQAWDGWFWAEGWWGHEQFWPKYMIPAGCIQIILRNNSSKPAALQIADLDGKDFAEVMTGQDLAGRIVWRFFFPDEVKPGGWVKCFIRLRQKPTKDIRVGLKAGEERIDVTVPMAPNRARIESISFSPNIDRLFIYVRGLDGAVPKAGRVRLDMGEPFACRWTPGPKGSALAYTEVALKSPWELGAYHLVEVALADGSSLAYPVRAWDSYYTIGLFCTADAEHVKPAIERKFNTFVHPGNTKMLDDMGMNYFGGGRERIPGKQSGSLFYYVYDEPDGADTHMSETLPFMDRLGLLAQMEVIARFREEIYPKDQRTPALLLVDNTYRPLNYYVYGQVMDVYCNDPYVPLGGDQVEYVAHALECARDASAPLPLLACLWACPEYAPPYKRAQARPPTPEEERLMAFYALGCGAKGFLYFADYENPPAGEGRDKPLWDEVGRINADILALAPYLACGCPAGPPVDGEKVWSRSIVCGRDRMVVVVVNKGHYIGYNTHQGFAWHWAAKDVDLSTPLPAHFKKCRVEEVKGGKLVPAQAEITRGELRLKMDVVDTGRAFVVTAEQR